MILAASHGHDMPSNDTRELSRLSSLTVIPAELMPVGASSVGLVVVVEEKEEEEEEEEEARLVRGAYLQALPKSQQIQL